MQPTIEQFHCAFATLSICASVGDRSNIATRLRFPRLYKVTRSSSYRPRVIILIQERC